MKTNALKKILVLAAVTALAAPLAASAGPPPQRRAPQVRPAQVNNRSRPAPRPPRHPHRPHGHRPHGYATWHWAPPPPPPCWAYYPPPPPPPPAYYYYRPGWSVSFSF